MLRGSGDGFNSSFMILPLPFRTLVESTTRARFLVRWVATVYASFPAQAMARNMPAALLTVS